MRERRQEMCIYREREGAMKIGQEDKNLRKVRRNKTEKEKGKEKWRISRDKRMGE